ncbi:DUF565 domain-containing protein [Prochlorococcus sp. MIT 0603]|uniref:DUF565 domain-containing protein n=1 Tax=Prochlorococcus sp. MIT 0603 TaxID=1499500 RepID=UPI00056950F8
MKTYKTNYDNFLKYLTDFLSQSFLGPWKLRSIGLISLLSGFYLSSILSPYYLKLFNQRIIVVLLFFLTVEIFIRIRKIFIASKSKYILLILDNLRIGITYSLVLEAFKLGS